MMGTVIRFINLLISSLSRERLKSNLKVAEKIDTQDLSHEIDLFFKDVDCEYYVLFPHYQEMNEGYYYDDLENNLNHIYYNSQDSIDIAIYDDAQLLKKDILYLNSISLRNYSLSFRGFSGSYDSLIEKIETIDKSNKGLAKKSQIYKAIDLLYHSDSFKFSKPFELY